MKLVKLLSLFLFAGISPLLSMVGCDDIKKRTEVIDSKVSDPQVIQPPQIKEPATRIRSHQLPQEFPSLDKERQVAFSQLAQHLKGEPLYKDQFIQTAALYDNAFRSYLTTQNPADLLTLVTTDFQFSITSTSAVTQVTLENHNSAVRESVTPIRHALMNECCDKDGALKQDIKLDRVAELYGCYLHQIYGEQAYNDRVRALVKSDSIFKQLEKGISAGLYGRSLGDCVYRWGKETFKGSDHVADWSRKISENDLNKDVIRIATLFKSGNVHEVDGILKKYEKGDPEKYRLVQSHVNQLCEKTALYQLAKKHKDNPAVQQVFRKVKGSYLSNPEIATRDLHHLLSTDSKDALVRKAYSALIDKNGLSRLYQYRSSLFDSITSSQNIGQAQYAEDRLQLEYLVAVAQANPELRESIKQALWLTHRGCDEGPLQEEYRLLGRAYTAALKGEGDPAILQCKNLKLEPVTDVQMKLHLRLIRYVAFNAKTLEKKSLRDDLRRVHQAAILSNDELWGQAVREASKDAEATLGQYIPIINLNNLRQGKPSRGDRQARALRSKHEDGKAPESESVDFVSTDRSKGYDPGDLQDGEQNVFGETVQKVSQDELASKIEAGCQKLQEAIDAENNRFAFEDQKEVVERKRITRCELFMEAFLEASEGLTSPAQIRELYEALHKEAFEEYKQVYQTEISYWVINRLKEIKADPFKFLTDNLLGALKVFSAYDDLVEAGSFERLLVDDGKYETLVREYAESLQQFMYAYDHMNDAQRTKFWGDIIGDQIIFTSGGLLLSGAKFAITPGRLAQLKSFGRAVRAGMRGDLEAEAVRLAVQGGEAEGRSINQLSKALRKAQNPIFALSKDELVSLYKDEFKRLGLDSPAKTFIKHVKHRHYEFGSTYKHNARKSLGLKSAFNSNENFIELAIEVYSNGTEISPGTFMHEFRRGVGKDRFGNFTKKVILHMNETKTNFNTIYPVH